MLAKLPYLASDGTMVDSRIDRDRYRVLVEGAPAVIVDTDTAPDGEWFVEAHPSWLHTSDEREAVAVAARAAVVEWFSTDPAYPYRGQVNVADWQSH